MAGSSLLPDPDNLDVRDDDQALPKVASGESTVSALADPAMDSVAGHCRRALEAADRLSAALDALLAAIEPSIERTPVTQRPTAAVHAVLQAQIAYERARR